jgi:hypothetical protein
MPLGGEHAVTDRFGRLLLVTLEPAAPEKKPAAEAPATRRILPMDLQLRDRIVDGTGEYEVIGRPYTAAAGKNAHVRVKRLGSEVTMIRTCGAHERVAASRT